MGEDERREATEYFELREGREAERKRRVSCWEMGDGPGTGGRGRDGGREGGGLGETGEAGMKRGGEGKDSRRRGTGGRRDMGEREKRRDQNRTRPLMFSFRGC